MTNALSGGVTQNIYNFNNQCIWQMSVTYFDEKGQETTKTIGYPLTINFSIERNTFASANTGRFTIYNLAPSTRNSLAFFQDRFATDKTKYVEFKAGYNGNLVTCFRGYILQSYSKLQGVDVLTEMECLDMGTAQYDYVNVTFEAGTTKLEAYKNIVQNCEGLTLGYVGKLEGDYKTAVTFNGDPLTVLNQITEGHTFIDGGVVHTLQNNESLDIGVTVLNPETGLLSTPERRGAEIVINSVFNPNIQVGQLLEIKDPILTTFNGTYMACGFTHSGVISGAVAGQRTTTIHLLIGDYLAKMLGGDFTKVKGEQITIVDGTIQGGAYEVLKYIQTHNGDIPKWNITPQINWVDMLGHENTAKERLNELNVEILSNCITIAQKLQLYMNANTPAQKIEVTSGWRCARVNAKYSKEEKSAHRRGSAIDFKYLNANTLNIYKFKYKQTWDKFTYLFRANVSAPPVIHVQLTLGKGDARRSKTSLV